MQSVVVFSSLLACVAQDPATALHGRITVERPAEGTRRVFAWSLQSGGDGKARELSKELLLTRAPDARADALDDGSFTLPAPGRPALARHVVLFAFVDVDGDGVWTPDVPEPCGSTANIDTEEDGGPTCEIVLRAPTHLERRDRVVEHGALHWQQGYPVVQLTGDAIERGHAHGLLLAEQIVDFFRFYLLEDRMGTVAAYRDFEAFLNTAFAWPEAFVQEIDAVLAGMRASGAELFVPELGRAFGRTELLAINAYIETRAMRSSCTQFVCWGERTRGTSVDGGTIAGRNMDGEIDLRRVTVSHFVLFAVTPSESGQKRYVSMMWPGFVGTLSGFNEAGVHCMENAGGTGPGPVVDRLQPISWVMREALVRFDATSQPESFEALLATHQNGAGGACGAGCIIVFALPSSAQQPGWVLEGDRFGHATRLPGQVAPFLTDAIMASNHHWRYGADADRPGTSFGNSPSFSSHWRYEAGRQKLAAWTRNGHKVGTEQMRDLLRTVAHGTTEHSIVTRPDSREFDVAVASMRAEPWDAPYRSWTTFRFDDLFVR